MALPDVSLTAGQDSVMDLAINNFISHKQRLEAAQELYNKAFAALEEYAKQSGENLGLDTEKDYSFDIATKKFVDRSKMTQAQPVSEIPANV